MNEGKGVVHLCQHIVTLYQDSNLRRDTIKDDSPFGTYASRVWIHTSHWSKVSWPATLNTTSLRHSPIK